MNASNWTALANEMEMAKAIQFLALKQFDSAIDVLKGCAPKPPPPSAAAATTRLPKAHGFVERFVWPILPPVTTGACACVRLPPGDDHASGTALDSADGRSGLGVGMTPDMSSFLHRAVL